MMRKAAAVQAGAELFPSLNSALALADPWALAKPGNFSDAPQARSANLARILVQKDYKAGWHLFVRTRNIFSTALLGKLLAVFPSGPETAHTWWPRAMEIKKVLDERSASLGSTGYAALLNLAANACSINAVQRLWVEMAEVGIVRDTNVWNQYIAALSDANPAFWPWQRQRSTSRARDQAAQTSVSHRPSVTLMLEQMDLEGVPRNTRTYELVILALSRASADNLPACAQLVDRLWIQAGARPGISGLTSILDAFAFHGNLDVGYELAKRTKPQCLDSHAADRFWTRLFRLALTQTQPRGNLANSFFQDCWRDMESYGYRPKLSEWSILIEYLEWKNQFLEMFDKIPPILQVEGGLALAQSAATRAAVGLANTGRALDAAKQLKSAHELGVNPIRDLEPLLAANGASALQLRMAEEDDEEDTLF